MTDFEGGAAVQQKPVDAGNCKAILSELQRKMLCSRLPLREAFTEFLDLLSQGGLGFFSLEVFRAL